MRGTSRWRWGVVSLGLFAWGCQETPAATTWRTTAAEHRDEVGSVFTVICPSGGEVAAVWGTDLYTDDSSICTAAVHSGLINLDDGGEVSFEMRGGASSYRGSVRQGVATGDFGAWDHAFVFVKKK